MDIQLLIQLANAGIGAILLYLLLKEQKRSEELQDQCFRILERLADLDETVTQEVRKVTRLPDD